MSADSLTTALESTHDAIQLSLTIERGRGEKKKNEASIVVERVHGREALSELFVYEVVVVTSAERASVFADDLAHDVTVEVARNGKVERRVRGIVTEVRSDGVPLADHRHRTTLVVMPKLAELQRVKTSRVYKRSDEPSAGYTVKDIVALLLGGLNVEARWALARELDTYVHRTQFQETHYDFMRRLLAFEGIHFYFACELEKTVIVFTDSPGAQEKAPSSLAFRTTGGGVAGDEVRNLRGGERIRTDGVVFDDYSYDRPTLAMLAPSPKEPRGGRIVYEHPGGYTLPETVGQGRAQRRLEELNDAASRVFGESNCPRLFAGSRFAITGHRDAAFDGELVATHVSFTAVASNAARGGAETPFALEFRAVRAGSPLRPLTRPWPIPPIQSAVVVGPEQHRPHVRAPGLVKVLFHWDVTSEPDVSLEDRCAWVRVATDIAGPGYGSVMWPRVGMEVVVDFLNGKLDEPVIVRALYNGVNTPPYDLPGDGTRSGFKSSTVGGQGHNEWYFEDAAGKELVYLHAQRDRQTIVEKHDHESVKGTQTVNVGGAQTDSVGGAQTVSVGGAQTVSVGGAQTVTVIDDRSITVKKGNETHKVEAGSRTVETKLADSLTAQKVLLKAREQGIEVDGAAEVRLHSGHPNYILVSSSGKVTVKADAHLTLAVRGSQIEIDQETIELKAPMGVRLTVGKSKVHLKQDGTVEISAASEVKVSQGANTVVLDAGGAAIKASVIKLNC